MSDEFEIPGRSFAKGDDEIFEALERPDDSNQAINFYNSSKEYVTTSDGSLIITTRAVKTHYVEWDKGHFRAEHRTKNYTSGMIQTWNKFCFTGGVLEMAVDLPGESTSGGLWPAIWMVGNLARATFQDSTMGIWPWSYDKCGDIDHLDTKQEINACQAEPGYGLNTNQGRGAPEIDIFEVMPGHNMPGYSKPVEPFMSNSLQISPGIPKDSKIFKRPINGKKLNSSYTWYDGLRMGPNSEFNDGFWGQECGPVYDGTKDRVHKYQEDAISVNTVLQNTHFERSHIYRLEWQPGHYGYLDWYLDDELVFSIEGSSIHELTGAMIPEEPMYLILNTAISHQWGMPEPCDIANCPTCWRCYDCTNPECQCGLPDGMKFCKNLPAEMRIDYIRLYQDPSDPSHELSCSPLSHPTAEFIAAHPERYLDWQDYDGLLPVGFGLFEIIYLTIIISIILILSHFISKYFCSNGKRRYIPDHNYHMDVLQHHMSTKVTVGASKKNKGPTFQKEDFSYSEIQPSTNGIKRSTSPFVKHNIAPAIKARANKFVHSNTESNEKKYLLAKV